MKTNEINIPGSIYDMPLKDYMAIMKIILDNKDNEDHMNNKIVQYYTGLRTKDIQKMPAYEYAKILTTILKVMSEKPDFQQVIKINGESFGFIPNFEKDLTTGEYIDLDNYMSDLQEWHRAMAILYRPITDVKKLGWFRKRFFYNVKNYTEIEEYEGTEKYAELMLEQPAAIMVGANAFFLRLRKKLLIHTLQFLQKQLKNKKTPAHLKEMYSTTMVGIQAFVEQMETSSSDSGL